MKKSLLLTTISCLIFLILFFSWKGEAPNNKYSTKKLRDTVVDYKKREYEKFNRTSTWISLESVQIDTPKYINQDAELITYKAHIKLFDRNGILLRQLSDTGRVTLRWKGGGWVVTDNHDTSEFAEMEDNFLKRKEGTK